MIGENEFAQKNGTAVVRTDRRYGTVEFPQNCAESPGQGVRHVSLLYNVPPIEVAQRHVVPYVPGCFEVISFFFELRRKRVLFVFVFHSPE